MSFRQFIAVAISGFLITKTGVGASVTLAWNASPIGALGGYRVYEGLASQIYTTTNDVGGGTNVTITGLVPGRTYYFAVTDYETIGLESAPSAEISYPVPLSSLTLQLALNKAMQAVLTGMAPSGYRYVVQACTNITKRAASAWLVIGTVTASATNTFQFIDIGSLTNRCRFYQLRQTYP
jgi:Fibronectin type III domain